MNGYVMYLFSIKHYRVIWYLLVMIIYESSSYAESDAVGWLVLSMPRDPRLTLVGFSTPSDPRLTLVGF